MNKIKTRKTITTRIQIDYEIQIENVALKIDIFVFWLNIFKMPLSLKMTICVTLIAIYCIWMHWNTFKLLFLFPFCELIEYMLLYYMYDTVKTIKINFNVYLLQVYHNWSLQKVPVGFWILLKLLLDLTLNVFIHVKITVFLLFRLKLWFM